jgi:hypothetical protein
MFQFPGFASLPYVFRQRYRVSGGFPHSEISGSKPAHGSPKLIAACHVLHRLYVPRHPPNALITLERVMYGTDASHRQAGGRAFQYLTYLNSPSDTTTCTASLCKSRYLSFTMSKRSLTPLARGGKMFSIRDRHQPLLTPVLVHGKTHAPSNMIARREWWAWVDSNYRPHAYQACALTT